MYVPNLFSRRYTQLSIFFKDSTVDVVRRVETYTITDFLSICGGLLGLFLGISLLSLVEIVYFASLRLFWNIRRPRPDNIETPPDVPLPENAKFDSWLVGYDQSFRMNDSELFFCFFFL